MAYTDTQIMQMRTEYINLLKSTNREGIDSLIAWLETSDFFYAPSSTKFHNNCKGGLLAHSLNVFNAAKKIRDNMFGLALPEKHLEQIDDTTLIISCLLHDLCKINYYAPTVKLWKDDTAVYGQQWKKYTGYEINDLLPLGHGEKSIIIAQQFIKLTGNEMVAIRWHMGFTDPGTFLSFYEKPAFMKSINDFPIVMLIAQADCFASFLMEKDYDLKIENAIE